MHNPRLGHACGTYIALPKLPTVRMGLQPRCDFNTNARRSVRTLTSSLTNSFQRELWSSVVLEQYHRLCADCQYILQRIARTVLTTRFEGIIK